MSELRRVATRWQIVGFSLNDVIGSGVYLMPALAVAMLGTASPWAILLAGLAVGLLVLCFAEAASYFEGEGGAYLYTRTAFGDFVGFQVGWMTWLARVTSVAALSVGFATALEPLWPAVTGGATRAAVILVPVLALAALNIVGVRSGIGTAVGLLLTKIVPLLLFVGVGVLFAKRETFAAQQAVSGEGIYAAALTFLFAFAGFENTAAPAGEFKNPRRDVPFALVINVTFCTLLYVGVQWVAMGTLPGLAASKTPLADAAATFMGPLGITLMTVGAALSILGTNSNTMLAGPRYLHALAGDGYGPRTLASISPRFRTPVAAIVLQTVLVIPLALTGGFLALAVLSSVARLVTYLGTSAAVPILRRRFADRDGARPLPGGLAIPIGGIVVTLIFLASASLAHLANLAAALAVGTLVFLLRRER